jgi:hypothetical protein
VPGCAGADVIETEILLGVLAAAVCTADTVPYVRDTLRRTTRPHRGSWLIWSVVAVVAVATQRADGGSSSLVPLYAQAAGTCLVLVLSISRGTGGTSRIELCLIGLAGVGVAGWFVVDETLVATLCVIAADGVAAAMMVPKTWRDPHSETLSVFVLAALSGALTVGAVGAWQPALLMYPSYYVLVNGALAAVIISRRRNGPTSRASEDDHRESAARREHVSAAR